MSYVKVVKNKAYFKRFQVKFRRRREGKTDYRQRRALVIQDKNKYQTPKYRFVVRFTNKTVICQVAYTDLKGDKIVAAAYSSELPRYGLKAGLKNYAAAYCTGLLCARRLLASKGLGDKYQGVEEVTGEVVTSSDYSAAGKELTFWVPELDDERRPFRAYLDVGVRATTRGARIFGALKGAVDGGLDIPHNEKRFPGYDAEEKEYNADVHRARIFGEHVAEYMDAMKEEDEDKYNAHFAAFIKAGMNSENLEDIYTKVHAAIRADPSAAAKKAYAGDKKYKNAAKKNLKQRQNRVNQKKAWRIYKLTSELAE
jgi:large subunit ribosomal protein L5e